MKSYKLVNSKEVQEKAFRLGYQKPLLENYEYLEPKDFPFLCLLECGKMLVIDYEDYIAYTVQEITQKEFLELSEPIKVGDWVKFETVNDIAIFKVSSIKEGDVTSCRPQDIFHMDSGLGFHLRKCTKLTEEQIKVLGLEDKGE